MDDLKERFDQFGKDPSPAVWDKIDSALDSDDDKIIGWWIYAAAGVVLLLGLGYYGLQNSTNENTNNIVEKVIPTLNEIDSSEINKELDEKQINSDDKTPQITYELESIKQLNDELVTEQRDADIVKDSDLRRTPQSNENTVSNDGRENESETLNNKQVPEVSSKNSNDNHREIANAEETEGLVDILQNDISSDGLAIDHDNSSSSFHDGDILDMEAITEIYFLDVQNVSEIENTRNPSPINRDLDLLEVNSNSWAFSANFKQGFIDNKTIGVNRLASANESFTLTNLDYKVESNYINDKPIWIDLQAQKKIRNRIHLIFSAEYGQQTSSITVNDRTIFSNANKNIGGGLGVGLELMKFNRLSIGIHGILRVGNEINDWKKNDLINNQETIPSTANSPSADILDQAVITNPESESNIMTNGEFTLPLKYQVTEKIGVQISPFVRKYLSQKYPGSDNFGESFQWGFGGGITF
jgi:hypothetical protein